MTPEERKTLEEKVALLNEKWPECKLDWRSVQQFTDMVRESKRNLDEWEAPR